MYALGLRACSPSRVDGRSRQVEHPRSERLPVLTPALGLLAASWGVVMACAPFLQMRRMVRARSFRGVSLAYFAVLIPGFGLWLGYGIASSNLALIVPNAFALAVHTATVALAYRLRSESAASKSPAGASTVHSRAGGQS